MLSSIQNMRPWVATSIVFSCLVLGLAGDAGAADEKVLERLEQIIKQQQAQIEEQKAQNEAQTKAIEKLQQQVDALSQNIVKEVSDATEAAIAKESSRFHAVSTQAGDRVSMQLYGQVNRAFLAADDGDSSDIYFVDNINSSSRFGLLGNAKVSDDINIGARMEFEYKSNASDQVNQDDKNPGGSSFKDRWIDAQFKSKRFGKLYLGKGSTASDGTSEVDLSGTDVVGYSSITGMAGGILFYDDNAEALSTTNVGNVFNNFDGLGRRNRFRYDSPEFWGFTAVGSVLSDGGDLALKYAAKWGENWKFAAAAAYANPQSTDETTDNQYNGSASILHSSGINLTFAGGYRDLASGLFNSDGSERNDDPTFFYGKLGYRAPWFEIGETRFSVGYNYAKNIAQDSDEGNSVGFQVVQDLPKWGSEYYLGYRWHSLDRDLTDYKDINAVMTGMRVKF